MCMVSSHLYYYIIISSLLYEGVKTGLELACKVELDVFEVLLRHL